MDVQWHEPNPHGIRAGIGHGTPCRDGRLVLGLYRGIGLLTAPSRKELVTSIRAGLVSDHAQLQALFEELDRVHRSRAPWLFRKPGREPRPLEWLEKLLASQGAGLFVADVGACIGLATVHLRDAPHVEMFIPQQHAVIDDLIVHPDWRRRGIARRLYDACEEWARARGAAWIEVNVYEFNSEAHHFYAAVGLETTMRRMRKPLKERGDR